MGVNLVSLLLLLCLLERSLGQQICQQPICEYYFEIRRFSSMTYYDSVNDETFNVELQGDKLIAVENSAKKQESYPVIGTELDPDDVITGDGFKRDIITINDQFPGPDIHVLEGSQVVVHVWNRMQMEALTIHWHGMHQVDTQWMDGVPYVTQCPVQPLQKFTYRFFANPVGTHWYHSHLSSQRLDGLYGMLVVHPSLPITPEFVFMVGDWHHVDATSWEYQLEDHMEKAGTGEMNLHIDDADFMLDNNIVSELNFYGAIINGRGRYNQQKFPLAEFKVISGNRYRFRTAAVGVQLILEISVDNHQLYIVAMDGEEIQPIRVDSVMVHPGENMDFELISNQPVDRYWIRAVTLREGVGFNPKPDNIVRGVNAILAYDGAGSGDPSTSDRVCSAAKPCKVFNCPYGEQPASRHKECIGVQDARSAEHPVKLAEKFGLNTPDDEVIEIFINFANVIGPSVNARKFVLNRAPLYRYATAEYLTPCDDTRCDAQGCHCTYAKEIPFNKTIQLVLTNLVPGAEYSTHHAMHFHGHSYAVLKAGYAPQDPITGHWMQKNPDVECYSDNLEVCTKVRWANGRPALNKVDPPVKDTVNVPFGGYVVTRFRSVNPGFWLFHCHMDEHILDGMIVVINEAPDRHPDLPKNFPDCFDFKWSNEEFEEFVAASRGVRLSKGKKKSRGGSKNKKKKTTKRKKKAKTIVTANLTLKQKMTIKANTKIKAGR